MLKAVENMIIKFSFLIRCSWLVSVIAWCCITVNCETVQKQFCSLKGDDCTFEAPPSPVILAKEGNFISNLHNVCSFYT